MAIDYVIFPSGSRVYFRGSTPTPSDLPSRSRLKGHLSNDVTSQEDTDTGEFIKVLQENRALNGKGPVGVYLVYK